MAIGVDATLRGVPLPQIGTDMRRYEAAGFGGVFVTETNSNPFLRVALGAQATARLRIGTGVALAFVRSPMDVAYTAWDLQALSSGRFVLGLGTQVRAHIERRFSATWSRPAARMADYLTALRSIWTAWDEGSPLDYRGEFFQHTLMPPDFRPPENPHGPPKLLLAGVRERMLGVAGEHADGVMVHTLHTVENLRQMVLPAVQRGLDRSGRTRDDFEVSASVLIATSDAERETMRRRIAFYGSTPGYRHVLDLHGWGEVHERLHRMSQEGQWSRMAPLVDDEILDTFGVYAESPETIREELLRRYDGLVDRVNLTGGAQSNFGAWAPVAAAMAR